MLYEPKTIQTSRLNMTYYHAGEAGKPKLMLVHGNSSNGSVYERLMKCLEGDFEMVAPDMRCFGDTEPLPIDATRGLRDFSDDMDSLAEALAWDKFAILGWSLGGGIVMQYAIDHSDKLTHIILQAPLSPFGFGGTRDEDGKMLEPAGLASGGGCAGEQALAVIRNQDRATMGATVDNAFVKPGFAIDPDYRETLISAGLSLHLGEDKFPGDMEAASVWPFFKAGKKGVNNTMAPNWCDLTPITEIADKPPILWIRGTADIVVSDMSMTDVAMLGKLGIIPGYPGEEACPPQPMVSQTRFVLEQYKGKGGSYEEIVYDSGHGPMIDNEEQFVKDISAFMGR